MLNSFNPELQVKDTKSRIKSKIKEIENDDEKKFGTLLFKLKG